MSALDGVQEGQVLYVLGTSGRATDNRVSERVVEKVGRRWVATTHGDRFDAETGMEDAKQYTAFRRAFPTRQALDRHVERCAAEDAARRLMQLPRLGLLSDEQLQQLIGLLRQAKPLITAHLGAEQ